MKLRARRPHDAVLLPTLLALACAGLLPLTAAAQAPLPAPGAEPAASAGPAQPGAAARRAGRSAPVTLNFVNADIEAVSRAMAVMTDRQILVDPRVKGVVTVYSEQPVSVAEGWRQFLAALRGLGFAVVDSAGLLKVVPEADAKLQTGTVSVSAAGSPTGAPVAKGDQVITQVFRLNYENPNNLVAVLRPLISPNNTINANPGNNTLVITDYADNLTRLGKIISALDQPAGTDVEVVPLKHALAADLAALVQKLGDAGSAAVPGAPASTGGMSVTADVRSNALIVRAANPARLAALRALIERLDTPGAGGPAGQIHVVYLKNADASKLATVLRAAFGGGSGGGGGGASASLGGQGAAASGMPASNLNTSGQGNATSTVANTPLAASAQPSTGGFIQADPATNSLVITAAEPLFRQIRAVIEQLDGRRAQVFVESMIVEMDAQKAAEFGFQWQGLLGKNGDRYGLVAGTNFGTTTNIINLSGLASSSSVTATAAVNGLNLGLIQKVNGVYTLGAVARFLENVDGTNILSTPNLVALDNEEAKIVVGQNVPFVTGTYTTTSTTTSNPFQTVERKDVGLTLKIKPQIGEGGTIRMNVYQENSSVVGTTTANSNGPTTNKNALETTVVVDDGAIMVLGGQMKEEYTGSQSKVPLLGDLPYVGNLFRSESRERKKTMILVFLRPVVMRDAASAAQLSMDRYEAIRARQIEAQPQATPALPIGDAPVLPERPTKSVPAQPSGNATR